MNTKVYVITHKEYTKPKDSVYETLHVGRALSKDMGYIGDNTGDNISKKNKSFCELTGIYWIWKNVTADIVGICHYRRYFVRDEAFLSKEAIEETLSKYDIITPNTGMSTHATNLEHYQKIHYEKDLWVCKDVIKDLYPDYLDAFDYVLNATVSSFYNMLITKKNIFDEYCQWLFDILFEVEKRVDISDYDTFQKRLFGYLSERLLRVWLLNNNYKIFEDEVRLMDPEDSENARKTVELKYRMISLVVKDLTDCYKTGNYLDVVDTKPFDIDFEGKIPVWVCWWQGLNEAPKLVRKCIESIERNLPTNAKIHFISMDNVGDYVSFPAYIVDKFEQGTITLTHMSDILRAGLLYRYGGLWIDATYFITKPFPTEIFTSEFYTLRKEKSKWRADITSGRWSGNFMKAAPNNLMIKYLLNAFYVYWSLQDTMVDYFLIDYLIASAYDNIQEVREMIEKIPFSQPDVFALAENMNKRFDNIKFKDMTKNTGIFKLSYKESLYEKTIGGIDDTFYGHLFT